MSDDQLAARSSYTQDQPTNPTGEIEGAIRLSHVVEDNHELNTAINCCWLAVQETPRDYPDYTARLDSLWKLLNGRYEQTNNVDDLNAAIDCCWLAVQETAHDHPDYAPVEMLSDLYEQTGNVDDLNAAIDCYRLMVQRTAHDHPDYTPCLDSLWKLPNDRYEQTNNIDDLNAAIDRYQFAVQKTPRGHSEYLARLDIMAGLFHSRFVSTASLPDLHRAISLICTAILATNDDASTIERCFELGRELEILFDTQQNITYLDMGIEFCFRALEATTENSSCFLDRLVDLAHKFGIRYDKLAEIKDLQMKVLLQQELLNAVGDQDQHQLRAECLLNLGNTLKSRYIGERPDLQEAITLVCDAINVGANDPNHPLLP
ncbi:hypothetical protein N7471_010627 [Penicillium samsonianum]|uniref:uncharacterized protein n=1 Tax=Penicillium samsonianum TaxID=1882272 RepID=UPI00254857A9|nr:uncharacterized protein N7471_010627 [Penicillium samsonianum]KAJ6126134.1 hypothetical protein N7471_010627 [Penicillium samsonianum]